MNNFNGKVTNVFMEEFIVLLKHIKAIHEVTEHRNLHPDVISLRCTHLKSDQSICEAKRLINGNLDL